MKLCFAFSCIVMVGFSQNVLQNPGFESWTGGTPDYWIHDVGLWVFQEDAIVHGGNFSVRDSCITQNQADADFQQGRFAVTPLTDYSFTVWVHDNDPAGRVRQGIYWHPSGSDWSSVYTEDTGGWQELTLEVTSPVDAESATVVIRAYDIDSLWDGDAVFYADDAVLIAAAIQPPIIIRVWHTPIHPGSGNTVDVYAWVSDDGTIVADTLFYGINDLGSPLAINHTATYADTFQYVIPGYSTGDTVFYYQKYVDDDGLETLSDTVAYFIGELGIHINEIFYESYGVDSACYIELYRGGGCDLNGFTLVGINGNDGSEYVTIDLSGYSIPTDGFFVVASDSTVAHYDMVVTGADMQNGPDNVGLRFHEITIDALGYGALNGWRFTGEWIPAPDVQCDHCLGRYPDGMDTDHNLNDFNDYTTFTPGQPNPAVSIDQQKFAALRLPITMNPVRSTGKFVSLIANCESYPLTVYDITGQSIMYVTSPDNRVDLASGVYFVRTNAAEVSPVKFVVVR